MQSFYFKYLEIPYSSNEIAKLLEKYPLLNTNRFDQVSISELKELLPSLFEWFSKHSMEPVQAFLINHGPGYKQSIHVDLVENSLAINIPLNPDAEDSTTRMYKIKDGCEDFSYDNTSTTKYKFIKYDWQQVDLHTEYKSIKPVLINIKNPHSAWNNTAHTRGVLSFRFKNDPWFLQEETK
jgi:hypothetical protein